MDRVKKPAGAQFHICGRPRPTSLKVNNRLPKLRVAMQMTRSADEQTNHGSGKILLVGDMKRAFLDVNVLNGTRFEVCAGVDEAINTTAKHNFDAIAVVISTFGANLSASLKDLRTR